MSVCLCLLNNKRSSPKDFFGPSENRRKCAGFCFSFVQIDPKTIKTEPTLNSVKVMEKTVCAARSANHIYFFIIISRSFFDTFILFIHWR